MSYINTLILTRYERIIMLFTNLFIVDLAVNTTRSIYRLQKTNKYITKKKINKTQLT